MGISSSKTYSSDDDDSDDVEETSDEEYEDDSSSSSDSQVYYFFCGICMEEKAVEEVFTNQICCGHFFCNDCVAIYIATKIQENISMVKCPDPNCRYILEPYQCQSIIPKEVFDRWGDALCENAVHESQKFYCPFNDCSALLVNDKEGVVTASECPYCNRLFCAQCKVAWHSQVDCLEFQSPSENIEEEFKKSLNGEAQIKEVLMTMKLAKKEGWKRCSRCKFYVEKVDGCLHISCRCGHQFCYGCGKSWRLGHRC